MKDLNLLKKQVGKNVAKLFSNRSTVTSAKETLPITKMNCCLVSRRSVLANAKVLQGAIKLAQKFSIQPNHALKLSDFAEILYAYSHMPIVLGHFF